ASHVLVAAEEKYCCPRSAPEGEGEVTLPVVLYEIQRGINILEANPIPDRAYSGLPVLHYDGPDKQKQVRPIYDEKGKKVGGEVHVRQAWYDIHIESDTASLDVSAVQDVPWTI